MNGMPGSAAEARAERPLVAHAATAGEASDGASLMVGLDIGGTKTLAVAVDAAGSIAAQVRIASGYGGEAVVAAAVAAVSQLRASLPGVTIEGVGIGIPGTVDHLAGEVEQALNLGLEHLALGPAVATRLGLPVHVENDVNAAALGAFGHLGPAYSDGDASRGSRAPASDGGAAHGSGTFISGGDALRGSGVLASGGSASHESPLGARLGRSASLAYLNLGTGLAAGLVLDGRLWRGATGAAGEIGHVPIDPNGPECVCGQRGCLEALASGSGIARQWGDEAVPSAAELWMLADGGDSRAAPIVDRLVWGVASGVRLLVLAHDVERIVLGGGLAEALGARLAGRVLETLRGWEGESPFLASLAPSARVVVAPEDIPLAALGAALAAEPSLGELAPLATARR